MTVSQINWEAIFAGTLGAVATTVASLVSFSKGRADANNDKQKNVMDGFKDLLDEMRLERAALQQERANDKLKILALEGRCAALEQHVLSLEESLRRQGLDVPRRPSPSVVVFAPKPESDNNPETASENDHG